MAAHTRASPGEEGKIATSSHHEDWKVGNAHQVAERGQVATDMYVLNLESLLRSAYKLQLRPLSDPI